MTERGKKEANQDGVVDETNFRQVAKMAIEKYASNGRVVDAVLWGVIIGLYEAALDAASRKGDSGEHKPA